MPAFSVRHRDRLEAKTLVIELDSRTRGRIRRLINNHDYSYQTNDQWNDTVWTSHTSELTNRLRDLYGRDDMPSPTGNTLDSLVDGGLPGYVFDALEQYLNELPDGTSFQRELNGVFNDERVPWRMLDGTMVQLDADFARDELAERSTRSLGAAGFEGAMQELRNARSDVVDEDNRGAIHNAGKAHESVMKALLGREDGAAKQLVQDLRRQGYFDGLPESMREPFIAQVLTPLPWMRNKLGGHGQGEKKVEVPRPYAELAVDLASSYVNFLISLKEEREGSQPSTTSSESLFAPAPSAAQDDDIPF